jgi:hypothetical protein
MIAEFVQPLGFLQHHLFDSEGFFQATIRDVYWQLHSAFYCNAGTLVTPSSLVPNLVAVQFLADC